ncbi:MAG: sugar phosphate isomerase/epimerase [Acidobacteria bacterium]|nr:sugar phosphate isomerase/epimerase [Acidobacteriota bacterium]
MGVAGAGTLALPATSQARAASAQSSAPPFKLGTVTYNLGKDWDVDTLIKNCRATGFEAVELRTTHKHGVEPTLSKALRVEVRKKFEDSPVRLLSLGSTCEYHSADPAVVRKNIEETHRFAELARDVGARGVKVRPNGFPEGVPKEKTLEQIGKALIECGSAAQDLGVELWVEVHGRGTEEPPNIRRIMDACNHPAVGVCWNSNDADVLNGSVKEYFELLKPWIRNVHINELWRNPSPWMTSEGRGAQKQLPGFPDYTGPYPYRELFGLLRAAGYNGYTLAEIPESPEAIRLMQYYRALWEYHAA